MTQLRWLPRLTSLLVLCASLAGCGLLGAAAGVPGASPASAPPGSLGQPQHSRHPQASSTAAATLSAATPASATPPVADATPAAGTTTPPSTLPPSSSPSPTSAIKPLPACRDGSKRVIGDPASDPSSVLLDTTYHLPASFVPANLVPVTAAGVKGSGLVDASLIPDLRAMAKAARSAGAGIAERSAYRSYQDQVATFAGWVARTDYQTALRFAARPGHSEHQLGTAIDFRSAPGATPPLALADWARTASGRWMRRHSWEYGFIESYPRGKTSETCYGYEPWHFRYVGADEAKLIHESGMTLRRYLWTHGAGVR